MLAHTLRETLRKTLTRPILEKMHVNPEAFSLNKKIGLNLTRPNPATLMQHSPPSSVIDHFRETILQQGAQTTKRYLKTHNIHFQADGTEYYPSHPTMGPVNPQMDAMHTLVFRQDHDIKTVFENIETFIPNLDMPTIPSADAISTYLNLTTQFETFPHFIQSYLATRFHFREGRDFPLAYKAKDNEELQAILTQHTIHQTALRPITLIIDALGEKITDVILKSKQPSPAEPGQPVIFFTASPKTSLGAGQMVHTHATSSLVCEQRNIMIQPSAFYADGKLTILNARQFCDNQLTAVIYHYLLVETRLAFNLAALMHHFGMPFIRADRKPITFEKLHTLSLPELCNTLEFTLAILSYAAKLKQGHAAQWETCLEAQQKQFDEIKLGLQRMQALAESLEGHPELQQAINHNEVLKKCLALIVSEKKTKVFLSGEQVNSLFAHAKAARYAVMRQDTNGVFYAYKENLTRTEAEAIEKQQNEINKSHHVNYELCLQSEVAEKLRHNDRFSTKC